MNTLELHPLCTLFPRLAGAEFEALKADIVAHGQHELITIYEGQILDGGNRYRACIEAGIEPKLKDFEGNNPASFVFSANFHRRHLTAGQQAVIVAQAQNWAKAQQVGRPEKSGSTAELKTVADRVAESYASERAQRMADQLARQAPELAKKVAEGKLSLPKAHAQLAPKPAPPVPRAPAQPTAAAPLVPAAAPEQDNADAPDFGASSLTQAAPAAPAPLTVDDIDDDGADFNMMDRLIAAEDKVKQLEGERNDLKARVAQLEAGDLTAQIVKLEQDLRGANDRAARHHEEFTKANTRAIKRAEMLDKIRRAAGLGKDADLVEWAKQAARRAA